MHVYLTLHKNDAKHAQIFKSKRINKGHKIKSVINLQLVFIFDQYLNVNKLSNLCSIIHKDCGDIWTAVMQ